MRMPRDPLIKSQSPLPKRPSASIRQSQIGHGPRVRKDLDIFRLHATCQGSLSRMGHLGPGEQEMVIAQAGGQSADPGMQIRRRRSQFEHVAQGGHAAAVHRRRRQRCANRQPSRRDWHCRRR